MSTPLLTHRWTCTAGGTYSYYEAPGDPVNRFSSKDVLRWGGLEPTWPDGILEPYGERMIPTSRTRQEPGGARAWAELEVGLGVAWWDAARHVLSVAFPGLEQNRYEIRRLPTR